VARRDEEGACAGRVSTVCTPCIVVSCFVDAM
jgi:hypothetical protein